MAELVPVADGAYPHADYGFLPPEVGHWGFYVGGHTPRPWTLTELTHLESSGLVGLPIWTAPVGRAVHLADATADAAGMLAGLHRLGLTGGRAVFYDVEHSSWEADPAQTTRSAEHWVATMRASGWPLAQWYGPRDSTAGWRADWTGVAPVTLPAGAIGVQYDHGLAGDRYDISVFDPTSLEVDSMPTAAEIAKANWAEIVQGSVHNDPAQPVGVYVANVNGRLVDIAAILTSIASQNVQTNNLLAEISSKLPAPTTP